MVIMGVLNLVSSVKIELSEEKIGKNMDYCRLLCTNLTVTKQQRKR